jgi:hypothetical protein
MFVFPCLLQEKEYILQEARTAFAANRDASDDSEVDAMVNNRPRVPSQKHPSNVLQDLHSPKLAC